MADEIGAKIVVSGDTSGGRSEVKALREETAQLTTSTKAAGQGAAELGDKLGKTEKGGGDGAKALAKFKEGLADFTARFPGASGAVAAFGEVAEAVELGPLAVLGVALAAVAVGIELLNHSVEEFAKQEVADTKLDQALAQSGQLTDAYREKLQALSAELQEATGIVDERWAAALARLTQFGADETNIDAYAEAVKNLAGLIGGDIERASQIFSRAINGNFSVLGRLGIQVEKGVTQHEKLDDVMRQLAERGGGQLEARTRTISGQFTTLENATTDVFKGFGNLISQTGILQEGLLLAAEALHLLTGALPHTVAQVEGLTNKLPPLRDETGKVKGVVDELGEGLDGMGDSADSATAGLERAGDAAGKAKEQFQAAAEAAKKLREQHDAMEDAKTALALAKVDSAEAGGRIGQEDANKERAQIRADAEQASLKRKVDEQRSIIAAQEEVIGKAHAQATGSASERNQAEAELKGQFPGADGDAVVADLDQAAARGEDTLGRYAKEHREKANAARDQIAADTAGDQGADSDFVDQAAIAKLKDQAETEEHAAEVNERARASYIALRQARENEAEAAKKEAEINKQVQPSINDARAALSVLGVQQQTASTKATAENARLARDAEKKRLEDDQKRLEYDLKNTAQPDAHAAADQSQYRANQLKLNAIQYGGDKAGLAVANATLPVPPGAEQNVKIREQLIKQIDDTLKDVPNLTGDQKDRLTRRRDSLENANAAENERGDGGILRGATEANRAREQQERDEEGKPTDAAVSEAYRAKALATGLSAAPGTSSAHAVDAVTEAAERVIKDKGANEGDQKALATAITKLLDALVTRNSPSRSEFAQLAAKVDQTASQVKNKR